MSMSFLLPTETWYEILSYAVLNGLAPCKNASLFEDLDVFGHPCKIYAQAISNASTLRLVCRLWADITRQVIEMPIFVKGDTEAKPLAKELRYTVRVEVLYELEKYCQKWPCALTRRHGGRCPQATYHCPFPDFFHDNPIESEAGLDGVRVLRLLDVYRDPKDILESCQNLEALSVPFASFRVAYTSESTFMLQLSHLHLDKVALREDDSGAGVLYNLYLPCLLYLKLTFELTWRAPGDFPLEIQMPNVKTIYLDGTIDDRFLDGIEPLILSARNSLVNLLLGFTGNLRKPEFPLEKLVELPKLVTLGIHLDTCFIPDGVKTLSIPPRPSAAQSLSLILLRLDEHHRYGHTKRLENAERFTRLLSSAGDWFSDIIVPFEWNEIEDLWVKACEIFDSDDVSISEGDPLPCLWSSLDYISRYQPLPIMDRNRVSLSEGDGLEFTKRMKAYQGSNFSPQYTAPIEFLESRALS
ncbi:hypothetical protein FRC16_002293 [Serendipita sp. 398]|nr:hypothetical protein FRC16_002293 [Serendipita sp. 398]